MKKSWQMAFHGAAALFLTSQALAAPSVGISTGAVQTSLARSANPKFEPEIAAPKRVVCQPGDPSQQSIGDAGTRFSPEQVKLLRESPVAVSVQRFSASPRYGFYSAFYAFVPKEIAIGSQENPHYLLIIPNNTGYLADDVSEHEQAALVEIRQWRWFATALNVALLVPAFPRRSDDIVYTHALSRSVFTTTNVRLRRPDLQLLAMARYFRRYEKRKGLALHEKSIMLGYSASGMFVNRFAAIHPAAVLAVAAGSPGGWPIAPLPKWQDRSLPFPVGIGDLEKLTGRVFEKEKFAQISQFIFMGENDANDSVPFRDSYSIEARSVVDELFGKTPITRWGLSQSMYQAVSPHSYFKLYPNVGHSWNNAMQTDLLNFFGGCTVYRK